MNFRNSEGNKKFENVSNRFQNDAIINNEEKILNYNEKLYSGKIVIDPTIVKKIIDVKKMNEIKDIISPEASTQSSFSEKENDDIFLENDNSEDDITDYGHIVKENVKSNKNSNVRFHRNKDIKISNNQVKDQFYDKNYLKNESEIKDIHADLDFSDKKKTTFKEKENVTFSKENKASFQKKTNNFFQDKQQIKFKDDKEKKISEKKMSEKHSDDIEPKYKNKLEKEYKDGKNLFKDKFDEFINDTEKIFNDDDEEVAPASYIDYHFESKATNKLTKTFGKIDQAKRKSKDIQKEIKALDKNLKKFEQSGVEDIEPKYKSKVKFRDSKVQFNDFTNRFLEKIDYTFRKENKYFNVVQTVENKRISEKRSTSERKDEFEKTNVEKGKDKFISQNRTEKKHDNNDSFNTDGEYRDRKFNQDDRSHFESKKKRNELQKEKKETDKDILKKRKKAAAITSVAGILKSKGEVQNQLGDMSGKSSGDLIEEGKKGLLTAVSDGIKNLTGGVAKKSIMAMCASAASVIIIPLLLCAASFILIFGTIGTLVGWDSDSGDTYDLELEGDGKTFSSLSNSDINKIIDRLYELYSDDMTIQQENLLRYSLSKVGCSYDQSYHASLSVDIFDCSSLAYRSYREVGIDISNGNAYSAAEECRRLENDNKIVGNDLLPGDLIFYGGQDNGRYKGIYHVAIYVGDGKMVEARGKNWGVVYGDVRTTNIVVCARPFL